jgi:hypothetical protein
MAAGMAVVSSRYVGSGLEGALVHGRTALLFPTGDAEAAAGQLARLQQVDLLQELAQAGFDLVQQRYSRGASAAAWMAALQAAADLDPLAPPAPAATVAPAGSLDRRLGVERAEWARRLLGRRFRHREAGSEWPHSGHGGVDPSALMERAEGLDFAGGGHG